MLITQGVPETEIDLDIKLLPEERIKLVMCSLIEWFEDEEQIERFSQLSNETEYKMDDNAYLIDIGLFMKEIFDKECDISQEQRQFIQSKWKEIETEMSQETIGDKNKQYELKEEDAQNSNLKEKEEVNYNLMQEQTKAEENKQTVLNQKKNSRNKDNNYHYFNNAKENNKSNNQPIAKIANNQINNAKKWNENKAINNKLSSLSFSISNTNENPIALPEINHSQIKPISKHNGVCINMLLGTPTIAAMNQGTESSGINNENTNHSNNNGLCPLFEYASFVYPTRPMVDISITTLKKYQMTNNNNVMITFKNNSVSHSLMNSEQRFLSLFSQNQNASLIKWLISLKVINNPKSIIAQFKTGALVNNIISSCENKKDLTARMSTVKDHETIQSNINKALEYFKKLKITSSDSWSISQIEKGEEAFVLKVLNSLHQYYSNIKPNQTIGTILFNDSITNDNMQNGQPMTQISSISNIPKGTRNSDLNNLASVNYSNNCTIVQCLNNNVSSMSFKQENNNNNHNVNDELKKTQKMKSRNASLPKKTISPQKNGVKLPDCFIIFQKSNIKQIKSQITKMIQTSQKLDNEC